MRVALAPSFEPIKAPGTATSGAPLLDPTGPRTVLGWSRDDLAVSIAPGSSTLFGPRGACLHPDGSLWVSDTGHHRLLGWYTVPKDDNAPADILIGQAGFDREGRNGKGDPGAATLNVPTGICAWGDGIAIADAWNHRVLIWKTLPSASNQPADIVLGQAGFSEVAINRGKDLPTADSLNWPYGIAAVDGKLVVADTGNRRVLIWEDPQENGQMADIVLGQKDFTTRDENAGGDVNATGMRWPHGLALWQGFFAVSDAGNNRVMLWDGMPDESGVPCDIVLGQKNMTACDHNMANYFPSAAAVNMPYGIAVADDLLIAADTANSRLIGWTLPEQAASADRLTGQKDFASKGDNGWGIPGRDTVCWPYGLSVNGGTVAIADSGNNRILLWDLA